jgi:hypothetical protein
VTFHTKVRSSGYGAEPPRQMFKPRMSGSAAGGRTVKKPLSAGGGAGSTSGRGGGGGGAAGAKLQYPVSSEPPVYFQAKHQIPVGRVRATPYLPVGRVRATPYLPRACHNWRAALGGIPFNMRCDTMRCDARTFTCTLALDLTPHTPKFYPLHLGLLHPETPHPATHTSHPTHTFHPTSHAPRPTLNALPPRHPDGATSRATRPCTTRRCCGARTRRTAPG